MTTDPQVTHPEVTHPETPAPASPEALARPAEKPAPARPGRQARRMPPPKVLAAAALVIVALELLVWQVGGLFWGGVIHGALLILAGLGLLVWSRWRNRREARLARTLAGHVGRRPDGGQRAGRGPLARLLGRSARSGSAAAGGRRPGAPGRRGLLSRLTGGGRAGGPRSGAGRSGLGTKRSGGLLGRLARTGASGRRTGSGPVRSGRTGGVLGRLGRRSAGGSTTRSGGRGAAGRRTGLRSALGRASAGGRSLLSRARAGGAGKPKSTATKPAGRANLVRRGAVAAFLRGVRQGAQGKAQPKKKPSPGPQHVKPDTEPQGAPAPKPEAVKPQQPTRAELVKEAVERVADASPAPVTSRRSRGTTVGSMRDILSAAEDLAAQMKAYDEEDMHVFVRELPQLGEALSAIEGGIKMMASRAESEWPLAAPVVEALGSVAGDVKAAAGTVGEAKQAVHRENETDIERGEAPRQGERRWNV